ncbi:MAG: aminoglycoside phosphotransferase family protein [Janthinobacterium lividum]
MKTFEDNILSIYKDRGKTWLSKLPEVVSAAAQTYGLSDLTPVGNLSHNYVLSGFQKTQPIILKLGLDVEGIMREAAALKAFSNFGTVNVFEKNDGLLLLRRAVPGISLKNHTSSHEAISIICRMMKKLHQADIPQDVCFPHINDWLKILDQEWNIPTSYLRKARQLRDQLTIGSSPCVLLHGDLHHDNIIQDDLDWLVIDPKGVIGPAIHEVWAFIIDMEKDTQYVADYFNYEVQVVRQWYFIHLILATLWNIQDGVTPKFFLDLAEKVYPIV